MCMRVFICVRKCISCNFITVKAILSFTLTSVNTAFIVDILQRLAIHVTAKRKYVCTYIYHQFRDRKKHFRVDNRFKRSHSNTFLSIPVARNYHGPIILPVTFMQL